MAGLADIITPLVTVLQGVPGITTVLAYTPESPGQAATLPEAFLEVMGPRAAGGKTNTRRVQWDIDIWIRTEIRPVEMSGAFAAIYPLPDAVMAALDAAGTFDGVLATTVDYDEPAVSHPSQGAAFGIGVTGDKQYVETCVHAIFTVDRVGGFGNG